MPANIRSNQCLTVEWISGYVQHDVRASSIKDWSQVKRYRVTGYFCSEE